MDTPNPSSEWTPQERLEVIKWLIDLMFMRMGPPEHVHMHGAITHNWLERIQYIAKMEASFLEQNRATILEPPVWQ